MRQAQNTVSLARNIKMYDLLHGLELTLVKTVLLFIFSRRAGHNIQERFALRATIPSPSPTSGSQICVVPLQSEGDEFQLNKKHYSNFAEIYRSPINKENYILNCNFTITRIRKLFGNLRFLWGLFIVV